MTLVAARQDTGSVTAATDRFALADRAGWAGHLEAQGYAVVHGLLTAEQSAEAHARLWALVEALAPVRRGEPSSWARADRWPPMLHGGMIQYLGHTELQWWLRAKAAPLFAALYGVTPEALATSFDGLCFMHGARRYKSAGELVGFLHSDQSPQRPAGWSVQGLFELAGAGPQGGGLVVVPGSHLEHEGFFRALPEARAPRGDWYLFTPEERERYRSRARKVCAQPGDFLLWDSRTFHCNTVPTAREAQRACAYVCMLPASRVTKETRAARASAWELRRTSSHHPADGFRLFPALPRFAGRNREELLARCQRLQRGFELDPLQRALLCA